MCLISARCPYLAGHIEAALKSSGEGDVGSEAEGADAGQKRKQQEADKEGGLQTATLCLEHATATTVKLLVRYLYTDELPAEGVSGETLGTLGGLAKELTLPRCVCASSCTACGHTSGYVCHTRGFVSSSRACVVLQGVSYSRGCVILPGGCRTPGGVSYSRGYYALGAILTPVPRITGCVSCSGIPLTPVSHLPRFVIS